MGRIRTTLVKRMGKRMVKEYPGLFQKDFEFNKKTLDLKLEIPSNKLRNIIAGYITKLVKEAEKD